jgi:hypothetical protein
MQILPELIQKWEKVIDVERDEWAVKKELRGKISITKLNEILAEIMEQVEGQFSDWSA